MPTYEYKCTKCDTVFERFQAMSDEPLKECPECGGPVKRLIGTGAGLLFKGSGFYATDYRSDSYKQAASADKSETSSSSSSSKSESKKADAKPKPKEQS